ncbi:MAG: hypothetical protein JXA33_27225 [Anaerolineae bacterium]|nr:hypothetical protein [Anaerolineae bacterium]
MGSDQPPSDDRITDDMSWDDLLGGIDYQEPEEVEPAARGFLGNLLVRFQRPKATTEKVEQGRAKTVTRAGLLQGFTRGQRIILGVLASLVLIVTFAVGYVIIRTFPSPAGAPAPGSVTVITPGTTPIMMDASTPGVIITPTAQIEEGNTLLPDDDVKEPTPVKPTLTPAPPSTPTPTLPPNVFTEYDAQIRTNPDNLALRLQRAEQYIELRAYLAALGDYEHARTLDETRAETYIGLGNANYHLCQWEAAEAAYGSAVSFNENLPEAHFGLGLIFYYEARFEEAFREFDWAAEINPDLVEAEAWLAMTSARMGNLVEASNALTRTLTDEGELPNLPLMYISRSWVRRLQNPPLLDGAQADLLHAQTLAPYDFEVLVALARFYTDYRPERIGEAEQLAQYALNWAREDLERARALHIIGRVYLVQNRKPDAKRVLTEAGDLATSNGKIVIAELAQDLNRAFAP